MRQAVSALSGRLAGGHEPICDTHSHVYPDNPAQEATLDGYLQAAQSIGVGRHVIVHAKAHRHDPQCTLDTVARLGLDRARAVVWEDLGWGDADHRRRPGHLRAQRVSGDEGRLGHVSKQHRPRVFHRVFPLSRRPSQGARWQRDQTGLRELPCDAIAKRLIRDADCNTARSPLPC